MQKKSELLKKIKQKKELSGLSNPLVSLSIDNYLKKYKINVSKLSEKEEKIFIKQIRAELRTYTGQFQKAFKKRQIFLEQNNIIKLLKTHSSTSERLQFYKEIKEKISELSPSSILDLGCGLNPIALASSNIKYYALDIKEDELKLIDYFFKKNNINGKTISFDIRNIENTSKLPKADLCLMFKILDIIETKNHKIAEHLIKNLNCKQILISFPTIKLSGKPMNHPRRIWIEKLLERINFQFATFRIGNEIFYLVDKTIPKTPLLRLKQEMQ